MRANLPPLIATLACMLLACSACNRASSTSPLDATPSAPAAPAAAPAPDPRGPTTDPEYLGLPCDAFGDAGYAGVMFDILCVRGRIAGFFTFGTSVRLVGSGFDVLFDNTADASVLQGADLLVSARAGVLVAQRTTCGRCEKIIGWTFVGDLAFVENDDLRWLACRLRGFANGDLRTAEAWRAFLHAPIPSAPQAACAAADAGRVRPGFLMRK